MATDADCDRLRGGDSSLKRLFICLGAYANISKTIYALEVTRCHIRDVRVFVSINFADRCRCEAINEAGAGAEYGAGGIGFHSDKHQVRTLFRTIGSKLAQLKCLSIHSCNGDPHPGVPIDWITEALRSINQRGSLLERLYIRRLQLFYDTKLTRPRQHKIHKISPPQLFLEDFMDALRYHPSLIEVKICQSCFRQNDANATDSDVESNDVVFPTQQLCTTLVTIKSLQSIEIDHKLLQQKLSRQDAQRARSIAAATITGSTLADLVSNTQNLQQLDLNNLEIYDQHLERLAQRLISTPPRNTSCSQGLQELKLTCRHLGLRGCQAIGLILREASSASSRSLASSLQNVNVRIHPSDIKPTASLDIPSTNALASGLTPVNDSTTTLVRRRPCLKYFSLDGGNVNNMKAFEMMMRVNCVLEMLHVTTIESSQMKWDKRELQCLLKLNAAGRYQLLHPELNSAYHSKDARPVNGQTQQLQQSLWVEAMARVKGDLECLFYLISANPSLCHSA